MDKDKIHKGIGWQKQWIETEWTRIIRKTIGTATFGEQIAQVFVAQMRVLAELARNLTRAPRLEDAFIIRCVARIWCQHRVRTDSIGMRVSKITATIPTVAVKAKCSSTANR